MSNLLQVHRSSGVSIYNLSLGPALPEWVTSRPAKRATHSTPQGFSLIQDLCMPAVSHRVTLTPDGRYLCALGAYKPRLRLYELSQLCMKCERCLDAQVIQLLHLSDDYTKLVMLR